MEKRKYKIMLHLYDLSNGFIKVLTPVILGK